MMQPFDEHGNLLCAACEKPITRFYVVVREREPVDTDPLLAVHPGCVQALEDTGDHL